MTLSKENELDKPSFVMHGEHRVVVLTDSEMEHKTVTVVPMTSLYDFDGNKKQLVETDVELLAEEYTTHGPPFEGTIKRDSFIRTDQVRTVSRHALERRVGTVHPRDMYELDVKLIMALNVYESVNQIIEEAVIAKTQQAATLADWE